MALLIPLTLPVSLPHQALNLEPAAFCLRTLRRLRHQVQSTTAILLLSAR